MNGHRTEFIRAVVRPIITLSGWGAVTWLVLDGKIPADGYLAIVSGLTAWWFATRTPQEPKPPPAPP